MGDSGPGLSDESRRHLFDPSFPSGDRRSFGAGLSVAYGVVARHGGDIVVQSRPGEGTTLVVRLPAAPVGAAPQAAVGAGAPARPLRILVVDDEPHVREVLATMLRRDGHEVAVAGDGWEGVARARESAFDLVMTDLGMPGLSGWEVARLVKETSPATPVALVTGWSDQLDQDEARRRHVDFGLAKPFTRQNPVLDKLADKSVAIVGTGATAIQLVPFLGKYCRQFYVLQRTPSTVDSRRNSATDPEWVKTLTSRVGRLNVAPISTAAPMSAS